jgi:hypothetical protein
MGHSGKNKGIPVAIFRPKYENPEVEVQQVSEVKNGFETMSELQQICNPFVMDISSVVYESFLPENINAGLKSAREAGVDLSVTENHDKVYIDLYRSERDRVLSERATVHSFDEQIFKINVLAVVKEMAVLTHEISVHNNGQLSMQNATNIITAWRDIANNSASKDSAVVFLVQQVGQDIISKWIFSKILLLTGRFSMEEIESLLPEVGEAQHVL